MTITKYILAAGVITLIVCTIAAGLFFEGEPVAASLFTAAFFTAMLVARHYFIKNRRVDDGEES